jgi:hypothetical protein
MAILDEGLRDFPKDAELAATVAALKASSPEKRTADAANAR